MKRLPGKKVFISYRRSDSWQMANWLAETISRTFGRSSVFIDTRIELGKVWPREIQQELRESAVLIEVIGPSWLSALDEKDRRRIDNPQDWVRREIEEAIHAKLTIMPVRVSEGRLPQEDGLPQSIRPLLRHNDLELRDRERETDVLPLFDRLEALGLERKAAKIRYPAPGPKAPPLTDLELKKALDRLPAWELDDSRVGPERKKKLELMRTYEFASFEDAIHFMSASSRYIAELDHHPDWENVWKTITVWLTTWDIGHQPSNYDIRLAEYLDHLYREYEPKPVMASKKRRAR